MAQTKWMLSSRCNWIKHWHKTTRQVKHQVELVHHRSSCMRSWRHWTLICSVDRVSCFLFSSLMSLRHPSRYRIRMSSHASSTRSSFNWQTKNWSSFPKLTKLGKLSSRCSRIPKDCRTVRYSKPRPYSRTRWCLILWRSGSSCHRKLEHKPYSKCVKRWLWSCRISALKDSGFPLTRKGRL